MLRAWFRNCTCWIILMMWIIWIEMPEHSFLLRYGNDIAVVIITKMLKDTQLWPDLITCSPRCKTKTWMYQWTGIAIIANQQFSNYCWLKIWFINDKEILKLKTPSPKYCKTFHFKGNNSFNRSTIYWKIRFNNWLQFYKNNVFNYNYLFKFIFNNH